MRATIWKRAAMLAIAGAFVMSAVTTGLARDRGIGIAAGIAAGALVGAAAAAASGPYYYDGPYEYDAGPVYLAPGPDYVGPGYSGYWGNTNSLGPNRAHMEHSN
jgi:ABC-type Fe3+-siderophore transport system permease subunit